MDMTKTRKRLIVEGHVQGVGYRALVTLKARDLKIRGFVRNLQDETVEIVCEGEPEALANLIKAIDRKGNPNDVFSLNVVSIKEAPPAPNVELARFYTDYGREMTEVERDSQDREEIMVYRGGTIDTSVTVVGQKVDSMHIDMNKRFDHMADRYDMIAASLKEAIEHMDRNAEKTDRAIEKSRKETIIEVHKSEERTAKILKESHNDLAASNRELAKAVNFMIKKLSDRPIPRKTSGKKKR
jgi:acylphosphatase